MHSWYFGIIMATSKVRDPRRILEILRGIMGFRPSNIAVKLRTGFI